MAEFQTRRESPLSGLVYVAAPSAGILTPPGKGDFGGQVMTVGHQAWNWPPFTRQFLEVMAKLRDDNPTAEFISPSLQNFMIVPFMDHNTKVDYETWRHRCVTVLQRCDRLLVCPFKGWETSEGVQEEINTALTYHIPVEMDVYRSAYEGTYGRSVPDAMS